MPPAAAAPAGPPADALVVAPPVVPAPPAPTLPSPRPAAELPAEPPAQPLGLSTAAAAGADGVALPELANALRDNRLAEVFDRSRDGEAAAAEAQGEALASGTALSAGVSIGYVLWLARGGALAASLLSALPAWSTLDPLPVLAQVKRRGTEAADDDAADADPIERLFGKARQLIGRVGGRPAERLE